MTIVCSLSPPVNPPIRTPKDIDEAIAHLTTCIVTAANIRSYTKNNRTYKNALPPEIVEEIASKNRLRREWQHSRDPLIKRRLYKKIKFIHLILKTHRADEWDHFLDSLDAQDGLIYKLNKKLLNKTPATPATHLLIGPNGLTYKDEEKAELFADTYEQQFKSSTGPDMPEVTDLIYSIRTSRSSNCYTSPGIVQPIVNKISIRKAPGANSITNTAIKLLPRKIVLLLTHILNGCLRIGHFPTSWKYATVITIPKPGKDHRHPANYRPTALLSSLSKIFERVILAKLNAAIGPKIRNEQFAFRPQHSTTHQLVKLFDQLTTNSNSKLRTAAVFLDVEKAFNRVWHAGLLYKLHALGTPISLLNIINSFLSERNFSVRINSSTSNSRSVQSGISQGSCLSPTLYVAYTNDVPLNQNARFYLFADDTLFSTTNKNPKRAAIQLQKRLDITLDWCNKWRLIINAQKTVAVMFNGPANFATHHLKINGHKIPWFPSSNPISTTTKINLLQLYVKPILSYAGSAWRPLLSEANWLKLKAVQNIGLRTTTTSP
ncbi:hypothetical protein QTP88_006064 [Uroleucon formosanum]